MVESAEEYVKALESHRADWGSEYRFTQDMLADASCADASPQIQRLVDKKGLPFVIAQVPAEPQRHPDRDAALVLYEAVFRG